jgi:threonine/homoserine/homoserine lactone efflux protein
VPVDAGLTVAFWGVSMLFVITPGADWAYAIASGLRHRAGVLPAVSGMLAGHLTATVIVATGVAAVLAATEAAMTLLTAAGAAYLIWLGASALRHTAAPDLGTGSPPTGKGRLFAKGVGISLLNPKVFLLFLALLPQFTSADAPWAVGAQMIVLGVLHIANCALVYFAVGYGAATILTRRPAAIRIVGTLSGIVMVGLGVGLIIEKLMTLAS